VTPAQAVDGLALAETTPGPLIMVLQFVGFLAAWQQPQGLSPAASAVIGALLTTYTTFLPSFLFILVGAPYVEVIRGNAQIGAALSGVTAAVVGIRRRAPGSRTSPLIQTCSSTTVTLEWPGRLAD
jgi:chromate transporter